MMHNQSTTARPFCSTVLGNRRGNENPFLLSFGILWFRYHNYWADSLSVQYPDWSDEKIFNEARKMVVGVHQVHCTLNRRCHYEACGYILSIFFQNALNITENCGVRLVASPAWGGAGAL